MIERVRIWNGNKFSFVERRRAGPGDIVTELFEWLMKQPNQIAPLSACAQVMGVSKWEVSAWTETDPRLWHEDGDLISADPT